MLEIVLICIFRIFGESNYHIISKMGGEGVNPCFEEGKKTPDFGAAGFPKSVRFEVSPVLRKGAKIIL